MHHATGRGAGATGLLDEARAIFARLGATPALARAEVLASRDVASPPLDVRPASEERASLTAREGEVLRLIAAGRSNREIAEALCLSVRTVERHVEKLYRKIDAHGRADATAFAFRHHLT